MVVPFFPSTVLHFLCIIKAKTTGLKSGQKHNDLGLSMVAQ